MNQHLSCLFRLFITDISSAQHGSFDSGENFQLCTDGWDSLTDLQEVCPNALVRALLGHLLGEPRDLVRRLGDVLGALDEGALVAAAASDQARHLGHEQRHALRRRDDVVALHGTTRSLLLPGRWQATAQQQ